MSDAEAPDKGLHDFWFDSLLASPDSQGWIILFQGSPVGFVSLSGLTNSNLRGEWGWYVASKEARGRGVGRAAQALGLDLAFNQYGLQRVWAQVLADNDAALRAQSAVGFRREGYLRRHILKQGRYHDVVILGMLAEEWKEKRLNVRKDLLTSGLISQ